MRRIISSAIATGVILLLAAGGAAGQTLESRLSKPATWKNLTIFLVSGRGEAGAGLIPLQEAMAKKLVIVHETGEVNELTVENVSDNHDVYIQSGDIVKGGRQDRVLAVDLVLPPRSGKIPVSSFCVEQGRWSGRGREESRQFSGSGNMISTRGLKLAVQYSKDQGEVWEKVAGAQKKLSENLSTEVNAAESRSSLQLTLENDRLAESAGEYVSHIKTALAGEKQAVGCVVVINGEVASADMYGSPALFAKLWPKLLQAAAVEAIAEKSDDARSAPPSAQKIAAWLKEGDGGTARQKDVTKRISMQTRDAANTLLIETRDAKEGSWIHRNYIRK